MRIILLLFLLFFSNFSFAELLRPEPNLLPEDVISIQLTALQDNNYPYLDAGIEQTWEFAHPSNKQYTGPLTNFINMMYSDSYSVMLNHRQHNINLITKGANISLFLIELVDRSGNKFELQWIVEKVLFNGEFKNCWMTVSVSQPVLVSKSV